MKQIKVLLYILDDCSDTPHKLEIREGTFYSEHHPYLLEEMDILEVLPLADVSLCVMVAQAHRKETWRRFIEEIDVNSPISSYWLRNSIYLQAWKDKNNKIHLKKDRFWYDD